VKLEVITHEAEGRARPVQLVFVHGVFSCARLWELFFQPFFAGHGYTSHAVSLRGHGASEGQDRIMTTRLRDYVADVAQVAAGITPAPVLVGTSMGGMIVQHYLQRHPVAAAVLLASGPPHGMIPSAMSMMLTHPLLAWDMTMMSMFGPHLGTVETARRALFREDTPDDYIARYLPYPLPEAPLAMLDVLAFDLPPSSPRRDVPVLVLGGEADPFISRGALRETATAFGVEAEVFPGMAHAMMLDRDWRLVATRILDWLETALPVG
jgi:pimeloyl-ACP methyl ester carboxylesterase